MIYNIGYNSMFVSFRFVTFNRCVVVLLFTKPITQLFLSVFVQIYLCFSDGCFFLAGFVLTLFGSANLGFYARKQLLLSARLSHRNSVRLSICLSVRPSHGWISQKRCKLGSPNLHRRLPESL